MQIKNNYSLTIDNIIQSALKLFIILFLINYNSFSTEDDKIDISTDSSFKELDFFPLALYLHGLGGTAVNFPAAYDDFTKATGDLMPPVQHTFLGITLWDNSGYDITPGWHIQYGFKGGLWSIFEAEFYRDYSGGHDLNKNAFDDKCQASTSVCSISKIEMKYKTAAFYLNLNPFFFINFYNPNRHGFYFIWGMADIEYYDKSNNGFKGWCNIFGGKYMYNAFYFTFELGLKHYNIEFNEVDMDINGFSNYLPMKLQNWSLEAKLSLGLPLFIYPEFGLLRKYWLP